MTAPVGLIMVNVPLVVIADGLPSLKTNELNVKFVASVVALLAVPITLKRKKINVPAPVSGWVPKPEMVSSPFPALGVMVKRAAPDNVSLASKADVAGWSNFGSKETVKS